MRHLHQQLDLRSSQFVARLDRVGGLNKYHRTKVTWASGWRLPVQRWSKG